MSKLKSKSDVIEWYWPDFLKYVMGRRNYVKKYDLAAHVPEITLPEFWKWYITDGPLGVKEAGRWYTKEDVEYV
jgi:hypothetical protein